MSKPRAYSYTRFSAPEQAQGDSARRQIELAKQYAAKHGLTLDDTLRLSDEGVSGFRGANVRKGALGQFLRAVDDGEVPEGSYLLVESLDRVSRQNPWDALPIFQQIINAGVTMVTLFDAKVYSREDLRQNPIKILESLFVMIRANEESETKSRRGKAVWIAKRRRAADRPLTSRMPSWLKMDRERIVPIPERVEVVRRVVRSFLGGMGQHRIAETLNRESVPVFGSGAMWHRSYVSKVLTSPALIGTLVPREVVYEGGKRTRKALQLVEGYFPAVISSEEWTDLQVMLTSGNRRQPQQRKGVQNVLAGLAECPLCGSAMTRVMKGSGPRGGKPKLVCTRAKVGAGCEYRALDLPSIEDAIRQRLVLLLAEAPSGDEAIDAQVDALRSEVEGVDESMSILIDELMERGRSPALSAKLTDLERIKAITEERLSAALSRQAAASPMSQERRRRELLDALEGPVETLNAKLRGVFSRVVPDHRDGSLHFTFVDGSAGPLGVVFAWPKAA